MRVFLIEKLPLRNRYFYCTIVILERAKRELYVRQQQELLGVFNQALKELERGKPKTMLALYRTFKNLHAQSLRDVDQEITAAAMEAANVKRTDVVLTRTGHKKSGRVAHTMPTLISRDAEDLRHILATSFDSGDIPGGLPNADDPLKLWYKILKQYDLEADEPITVGTN